MTEETRRNRRWDVAVHKADGDEVAAAIDLLRTSIAVHEEWLEWTERTGESEHGSAAFHRECIDAYEHIIEVIERKCGA